MATWGTILLLLIIIISITATTTSLFQGYNQLHLVVCVGSVLADERKANSFLRRFDQDGSSTDIVQECCKEGCHMEEIREYC